jgi:hypothetical protein
MIKSRTLYRQCRGECSLPPNPIAELTKTETRVSTRSEDFNGRQNKVWKEEKRGKYFPYVKNEPPNQLLNSVYLVLVVSLIHCKELLSQVVLSSTKQNKTKSNIIKKVSLKIKCSPLLNLCHTNLRPFMWVI